MGASHKKAAREYQRANPGTTLHEAMRRVARPPSLTTMTASSVPWARGAEGQRREPWQCSFCGHQTALLSYGDLAIDPGRVQVYCDNDQCDAREVEVIIVDDGTPAPQTRADVRIMLQTAPAVDRPAWTLIETVGDWIPGADPAARTGTSVCVFCGGKSCVPGVRDVAGDTGRLRLRCTESSCSVKEMEVLVIRDGTPWTQDRADVHALEKLYPRGPGRPLGEGRVYSLDDYRRSPEDVLRYRISGPSPT